ncbi:conjugal transfer protein [Ferviditalea candida]|uniref:Conjugal transfer protein n=1 Tax=Ferviditalea candida TaxID=3108399 RepID=A0ABU5ZMF7_9BACL|nr:conjugal transfer protein [Paenibacillaceae bacterium T2]
MGYWLLPRLLLWSMLTVSCLGAASTLLKTETDPSQAILKRSMEQQMAVQTAVSFAREWMRWDGEELPEARIQRLKPYVSPEALNRVAALQSEQKTNRQNVIASEFMSLASASGSRHTVRIRVIALNPERLVWEVDVPVWAESGKGAAVTAPPLIRPLSEAPVVTEPGNAETSASGEMKQRMRPVIESFLKAVCEGKDAESLSNYVTTGAKLTPLKGRIRFVAMERLDATGAGPYAVTVTFLAKDEAAGFRLTQIWKLTVTEENGKFFVSGISA